LLDIFFFLVICSKEVQVVGFLYIEEEQER